MPSVTAARDTQELPGGHGLAVGEITVAPGASQEHGNVVVSCPPGGTACALTVALDGTASYDRTGGMPSVTAARDTQELPGGHGLAVGEITVAPGASQEHGNVVVSCPPGGTACALTVALDGTASYDRTGGMPSVTAARDTQELPGGHGLAAGEITVAPGASQEHGNVVVSCPPGGTACALTVAPDGTASYDRTGGMPSVTAVTESIFEFRVTQNDQEKIARGIFAAANNLPSAHSGGGITQSSNRVSPNVATTSDAISAVVDYGRNGRIRFTLDSQDTHGQARWSVDSADRRLESYYNYRETLRRGAHLRKDTSDGRVWVNVHTDDVPTEESGTRRSVKIGDFVSGLSPLIILFERYSGTLNGENGDFICYVFCRATSKFLTGIITSVSGLQFIPVTVTPSTNYLALGTWLHVPSDTVAVDRYEFGAFADGNDPFEQRNLQALTGTATYEGDARGVHYTVNVSETSAYFFDADVTLQAEFGSGSEMGTISGRVDNFEKLAGFEAYDYPEGYPGSTVPEGYSREAVAGNPALILRQANIGTLDSGFFAGNTSMQFDGNSLTGKWGGQFYGNGELATDPPSSVAGTFGAATADGGESLVGAFGAHKQ